MTETGRRLPTSTHTAHPWQIHALVPDFRLEDVWELPGTGGPGDFPRLVELIASMDPARGSSRAAGALWRLRWKLGALFGWDDPRSGVGARVASLRDRLNPELEAAPRGPAFSALPFRSLYLLEDEWAAEIANSTMHGVLHLAAVPDHDGHFRAQMAVYVKPNGLLGKSYMVAIRPFRHLVVYPPMLRDGARAWESARANARSSSS
jgi:hypothetical protein